MAGDFLNWDNLPEVKRTPWVDYLLRPALLTIMITCLGVAMIQLGQLINPAWHSSYFLTGIVLITLEAIYSYQVLQQYRHTEITPLHYRLVEWGILLLLLKGLSYSVKPMSFVLTDLYTISRAPFAFFSPDFGVFLFLALLIWSATTATMADFDQLYDPFTFRSAAIIPYQDLRQRFFWGGGLLVLISGITIGVERTGLNSLVDFKRPTVSGIVGTVMIYFLAGLILISHAQLAMLLTRWEIQRIPVTGPVVKQWVQTGLIVLIGVTGLVMMLPTGYSLGFLTTAGMIISYLMGVLVTIAQFLMFLISLPFMLLSLLFGNPAPFNTPVQPFPMPPPVTPVAPRTAPLWWEVIRSMTFWTLITAIVWYLIGTYFKDHPQMIAALQQIKLFRWSLHGWLTLWQWITNKTKAGLALLPRRLLLPKNAPALSPTPNRWHLPRLKALSAREQILYYYLNILQRAERSGLHRPRHQTPAEFASTLKQAAQDTQPEIDQLTGAFIHARYSPDPPDQRQAQTAKIVWQKIRNTLRRLVKQAPRHPAND